VVVAALAHNYSNLLDRKILFDLPAFKKLDFYGRLDGAGSIANELETFLLGKYQLYYFRLNILNPELKVCKIEIVPLIDLVDNKEMRNKLKKEHGFKQDVFFGQTIKATQKDLEDDSFLTERLISLEKTLADLGIEPLLVDHSKLVD
jgi:hypothetical protein